MIGAAQEERELDALVLETDGTDSLHGYQRGYGGDAATAAGVRKMQVQRLQHVSVPRPPGEEAQQRAIDFYTGVLGLEHIPSPRTFEGKVEVTWFRCGDSEIHVYATHAGEQVPHSGAHFCLVVADQQAAREHLERAGYRCDDALAIPNRPRFYTWDPFGNWIEIAQIDGDYL